MGIIGWIVLAVAAVYIIMVYNGLVSIKNNVAKAWANIDVLLKQRHDELPKLVDTCKQYMKHEQDTLEKVIQARSRVSDARESQNIPALGVLQRAPCAQAWAIYSRWPNPTPILKPTRVSCSCNLALAAWKTQSLIAASFITIASISTMYVLSNFPT